MSTNPHKETRPYGLWDSPITPRLLAHALRLTDVQWDGNTLAWVEGRSGQNVIVVQEGDDAPRDLLDEHSARGGVGYGGGDFTIAQGVVYFAQKGRLYRQRVRAGVPRPITPQFGDVASPAVSPNGRWVLFVHSYERVDVLALVDAEGKQWPQRLVVGADFYMQPVWHPSGRLIAWVEWDHPNMPWDGTRLFLGRLEGEPPRLGERTLIAGGQDVPVFQPAFSPDGRFLSYIVTEGEWDSLVLYDVDTGSRRVLLGGEGMVLATPAWLQGMRTYGWSGDSRSIYIRQNQQGFATLLRVDVQNGRAESVHLSAYTWVEQPAPAPAGDRVALIASAARVPTRIVTWEQGRMRIHRRSTSEVIPLDDQAEPVPIQWQAEDGTTVHALYYPPTNSRFEGAGLPPAIINIHGGPTSQRVANYNADAQFFASRGWAYVEVNYRGSTGYGKSYMDALKGHWGEYDVADAVGAARALADQGLADPKRMVIKGGSAGGYTVLNTLIRYPGVFKAGICLFGVSNLFTLAADTHKFEERYLDSLVGPLPEAAERYREWSPIFHADRIRDPIAVFQGDEDKVVPPDQSESIVSVLKANRVPHIYRLYKGEGHGWRKAETIETYYRDVLAFLREHVLFS